MARRKDEQRTKAVTEYLVPAEWKAITGQTIGSLIG